MSRKLNIKAIISHLCTNRDLSVVVRVKRRYVKKLMFDARVINQSLFPVVCVCPSLLVTLSPKLPVMYFPSGLAR